MGTKLETNRTPEEDERHKVRGIARGRMLDAMARCPDLDATSFRIGYLIVTRINLNTGCSYPGRAKLAEEAGCSVATVKRSVQRLVDDGWLILRSVGHGKLASEYEIDWDYWEHLPPKTHKSMSPVPPPGVTSDPTVWSPMTPPGGTHDPTVGSPMSPQYSNQPHQLTSLIQQPNKQPHRLSSVSSNGGKEGKGKEESEAKASSGAGAQDQEYEFYGEVVRVNGKQHRQWLKAFRNIPNLLAEYARYDAWMMTQDGARQKTWFHSLAADLARKDAEYAAKSAKKSYPGGVIPMHPGAGG